MIGCLTGKIISKFPQEILLDVSGVGYELAVSSNTLSKLPDAGQIITIHTHLLVREDAHILYGFYNRQERALFRALIKVNGVGPKLALRILSAIEPERFVHCIYEQDINQLIKLPGIGKKTAERLMIDIRDRLTTLDQTQTQAQVSRTTQLGGLNQGIEISCAHQDAVSALISLGFPQTQASLAVAKVDSDNQDPAVIVREALSYIRVNQDGK